MITLLMILFIILCFFLGLFILIQQGKGDMGLGSLARGSQTLFGGSGGQDFFEKITWILGAFFMLGALALSILKTSYQQSRIQGYQSPLTIEAEQQQKNGTVVDKETTSPVEQK